MEVGDTRGVGSEVEGGGERKNGKLLKVMELRLVPLAAFLQEPKREQSR